VETSQEEGKNAGRVLRRLGGRREGSEGGFPGRVTEDTPKRFGNPSTRAAEPSDPGSAVVAVGGWDVHT
jgi:hypothetical protein